MISFSKYCSLAALTMLPALATVAQNTSVPPVEPLVTAAADTEANATKARELYVARQKGIRALGDGIYTAAARFFLEYRDAANFAEPEFADATVLLVRAYLQLSDAKAAGEALDYHSTKPQNLTDDYYRDALTYWRGATELAAGDYNKAIGTVITLLEEGRAPEFRSQALELLGDAYVKLQEWEKAQVIIKQLLEEYPEAENSLRARLGLVKAYLASGRAELAEQMLNLISEKHPDQAKRRVSLFRVLVRLQLDQIEEAFGKYRDIENQRPKVPDYDWWMVVAQLADKLIAGGDREKALTILPQAAALATTELNVIQAKLRRAECLIALGKAELAINALQTFKTEHPAAPQGIPVQLQLAELLRSTGNFLVASEYFMDIAGNENVPREMRYRAAYSRGWCFNDAGQFEKAVDAFTKAGELGQSKEQQADALLLAGDAAFRLENFAKSAVLYQTVADTFTGSGQGEKARFKQAMARVKGKIFANAALIFVQFLKEYPDSPLRDQARLERGIALKLAGNFDQAADELRAFADDYPEHDQTPRALIEAYEAAFAGDKMDNADAFLTRILEKHTASTLYPHALYQRAHLNFVLERYDSAVNDSQLFLDKFNRLPMAADVFIWLGDYRSNQGELEKSEDIFLSLVTSQPQSSLAPMALYEAAKSAYTRDDLKKAELLLSQLDADYQKIEARMTAQKEMLRGDLFAKSGKFTEAADAFMKAMAATGGTRLGLAAAGRAGEMIYSTAGDDEKALEKALGIFNHLVDSAADFPDVRQKAVYRRAKVYEKMGRTDSAIKEYLDIVYQFDIDLKEGRVPDWYYFTRAGYDVTKLLVEKQSFRLAARVYERMASSGIPTAAEARQRAEEIRKSRGLHD